ncbi:MAG: hypothetical protein IPO92_13690 [Saprospiraceae bacterium]|nr:hypothetical protein [Saprospiraceae bacterium]
MRGGNEASPIHTEEVSGIRLEAPMKLPSKLALNNSSNTQIKGSKNNSKSNAKNWPKMDVMLPNGKQLEELQDIK